MRPVVVCVCVCACQAQHWAQEQSAAYCRQYSQGHSTTYTTGGRSVKAMTEFLESQKHKLLQETEE